MRAASARTPKPGTLGHDKARAVAQEFEATFLNSMLQQMFTDISGEGPFGGSGSAGVWRSFLTDEYAKNFARAGGIGLSDTVYRELLAKQGTPW
jgi:Rod binding domain-containing protein